jgi:hypothetical protein
MRQKQKKVAKPQKLSIARHNQHPKKNLKATTKNFPLFLLLCHVESVRSSKFIKYCQLAVVHTAKNYLHLFASSLSWQALSP